MHEEPVCVRVCVCVSVTVSLSIPDWPKSLEVKRDPQSETSNSSSCLAGRSARGQMMAAAPCGSVCLCVCV